MPKEPYDQSELFRSQQFSKLKIDHFYVLLGTLDEYMGGYANPADRIDYYYGSETDVVDLVYKICSIIISEFDLEQDCELIKSEKGSFVQSDSIKRKLNAFFDSRLDDFLVHKRYASTNYEEMSDEQEWSYLLGVYIRSYDGIQFRFANAKSKVKRTHQILCNCSTWDDDEITMKSYFATPHVTVISLNQEHRALKELKKCKEKLEKLPLTPHKK